MSSNAISVPAGDPAALLQLANELDGHATAVGQLSANSAAYSAQAKSAAQWSGDAADSYTTFTKGVAQGSGAIPAPLNSVANAIRNYAGVLKSVQQQVGAASSAATSATTQAASNAASVVASAQSDANAALDQLEKAAGSAKEMLAQAVEDLNNIWEKTDPVRSFIDKLHAPWDAAGADVLLEQAI